MQRLLGSGDGACHSTARPLALPAHTCLAAPQQAATWIL